MFALSRTFFHIFLSTASIYFILFVSQRLCGMLRHLSFFSFVDQHHQQQHRSIRRTLPVTGSAVQCIHSFNSAHSFLFSFSSGSDCS